MQAWLHNRRLNLMATLSAEQIGAGVESNHMQNSAAFHGMPGCTYQESPFATEIITRFNAAWFNGVYKTDGRHPDLEAQVKQTLQKYKTPMLWRVGPTTKYPERLHELLPKLGLKIVEQPPAMALKLDAYQRGAVPDGLTIQPVSAAHQIDDFLVPMCEGFSIDSALREHFRNYALSRLPQSKIENWFVGYFDGQPVASGTLYTNCGINMIYNICTTQPFRGRGFARAIIDQLISIAPEPAARPICLYSSALGLPVYKKIGFVEQFIRTDYEYIPGSV